MLLMFFVIGLHFNDLFKLKGSVVLEGQKGLDTDYADLAVRDNKLFFLGGPVYVFSKDGELLDTLVKNGSSPEEMNGPTEIEISGKRLYVIGPIENKLIVFNISPIKFEFSRILKVMNRPSEIAIDSKGYIYIAGLHMPSKMGGPFNPFIVKYNPNGDYESEFFAPPNERYMPYVAMGHDVGEMAIVNDTIFFVEKFSPILHIFNTDGKELLERKLRIPGYVPPSNLEKKINKFSKSKYAGDLDKYKKMLFDWHDTNMFIWEMVPIGNDKLLIQIKNKKGNGKRFLLVVIDHKGRLLKDVVYTDQKLTTVDKDGYVYFLKSSGNIDKPISVMKYEYVGGE